MVVVSMQERRHLLRVRRRRSKARICSGSLQAYHTCMKGSDCLHCEAMVQLQGDAAQAELHCMESGCPPVWLLGWLCQQSMLQRPWTASQPAAQERQACAR